MKKILFALPLIVLLAAGCNSNSDQVSQLQQQNQKLQNQINDMNLDAQSKCADQAAKVFKQEDSTPQVFDNYTDHWNKSINKCFILMTFNQNGGQMTDEELMDAFGGQTYGSYWSSISSDLSKKSLGCNVYPDGTNTNSQTCTSQEQFDSLVKPFMTN